MCSSPGVASTRGTGTRRRRGGLAALGVLVALGLTVQVGACVLGAPRYEGPVSDHFDGERFHNPNHARLGDHGFGAFLRWQLERERGPWRSYEDAPPGRKPPERVTDGRLRVTFVNHATVLVQQDGVNLLTDPIWSERCSPFSWVGPTRVRPPGLRFEDLPPIDVVVISHNHYDHMDLPTLARLDAVHHPRFFVGLGNAPILARAGIERVTELDWWDAQPIAAGVRLHSVPVQHFSGRSLGDRDRTLWTGYVLEGPAGKVYFAGDTGFGPHFAAAAERLGPFRAALLPIGAFRPEWFMSPIHISPEQAAEAHEILDPVVSVAIHFGTFPLADDGQHEPVRRLAEALGRSGIPRRRFWVLGFGEGREVPAAGTEAAR